MTPLRTGKGLFALLTPQPYGCMTMSWGSLSTDCGHELRAVGFFGLVIVRERVSECLRHRSHYAVIGWLRSSRARRGGSRACSCMSTSEGGRWGQPNWCRIVLISNHKHASYISQHGQWTCNVKRAEDPSFLSVIYLSVSTGQVVPPERERECDVAAPATFCFWNVSAARRRCKGPVGAPPCLLSAGEGVLRHDRGGPSEAGAVRASTTGQCRTT
jgi:hypothetical protein